MRVSRKGQRGGGGARVTLFVIMRVSRKGKRRGKGITLCPYEGK